MSKVLGAKEAFNEWAKYTQFGAWRTEDEIKQVVAALRIILKGGLVK